jgi:hypothetical protein
MESPSVRGAVSLLIVAQTVTLIHHVIFRAKRVYNISDTLSLLCMECKSTLTRQHGTNQAASLQLPWHC